MTYHYGSEHRSLDHPPDGSVVVHVPTAERAEGTTAQSAQEQTPSLHRGLVSITHPLSSKCHLSTAQMITHTVGVPVANTNTDINKDVSTRQVRSLACVASSLTPTDDDVPVEVSPFREEGLHQQGEQVQTLYEEPKVVREDAVVEEYHHCSALELRGRRKKKEREEMSNE